MTHGSVRRAYFPGLERAFDYAHSRGALVLLTGYQTPAAIRRIGKSRLQAWLVKRKVRSAEHIATEAVAAAAAQHTVVPGQDVAATIVADLAAQLLALDERLKELDVRVTTTFRAHPQAEIIESLPGMAGVQRRVPAPPVGFVRAVGCGHPSQVGHGPADHQHDSHLLRCPRPGLSGPHRRACS
jgi:hypothetical protein